MMPNTPGRPLRRLTLVLVWALTAQYLLGAYVAHFVDFPEGASWQFAWSEWTLAAHMLLAAFVIIGTAWLCVRAWRLNMPRALWLSILSLAALLMAAHGGVQFVETRSEWWSYAMAVSFIVAMTLLSYVLTVKAPGAEVDNSTGL